MNILDFMPLKDAIELYYEKHYALDHGDMSKLIKLKHNHPELFNAHCDSQLFHIIQQAKQFQLTPQYKVLWKQHIRKKLELIIEK